MATEIRSKDYSFPKAINAVGKKLVPGWTGKELDAQGCRSPEDVESAATRPERHLKFMKENPGLVVEDWPIRIADAEALFQERQSGPLKQEIEDLKQDPEAYQERYDLWCRLREAERPFNDIMHHGHAFGWIETPKGDKLDIQPTHWHWGGGGPFTPPQLPGTCGEYRGVGGLVWIGKERLDAYLRTLAAGRKTRGDKNRETLQRNKRLAIKCARCKQEDQYQHQPKSWIANKIAKETKEAVKTGMEGTTLLRILYNDFPDWDKDPNWAK